jgi:hypothetical protein
MNRTGKQAQKQQLLSLHINGIVVVGSSKESRRSWLVLSQVVGRNARGSAKPDSGEQKGRVSGFIKGLKGGCECGSYLCLIVNPAASFPIK